MNTPKRIAKHHFSLDLIESLREQGVNPVTEFFKTLALVDDPAIKAKLLLDVFEYVYPKRKAVDLSLEVNTNGQDLSHQDIKAILAADPFLLTGPTDGDA